MNPEIKELADRLPLITSQFKEIREDGDIYVDKTQYIYEMVRKRRKKTYFLSRPRRFGKSLLLKTIGKLFEGEEELFRGLYIHDKWDWKQSFPVIFLDFSDVSSNSAAGITQNLLNLMKEVFEIKHNIEIDYTLEPKQIFKESLLKMYMREKSPLVLLIDEYDVPILSTLGDSDECEKTKRIMHDFYRVIKKMEEYLRFVILTGISKFSGVSIFSALNNLIDISLRPNYSAICGYTEAELNTYFKPFMEAVDRKKFREMYNGYNWLGEPVYNPVDAMMAIEWAVETDNLNDFPSFWFRTGTPSFLVDIMKERGVLIPNLGPDGLLEDVFAELSIDHMSTEALLFQTGYLTIAERILDKNDFRATYRLKYPNLEVQSAVSDYFLKNILIAEDGKPMKYPNHALEEALAKGDIDALLQAIHQFFASLSHNWYRNNTIASSEGFYCSVIFTMLAAVCNQIEPESQTNQGQIDLFASKGSKRYVFEVKVRENAQGAKGLDQIIRKGYAEKYKDDGDLYLVAIEFSREARNIVELEYCVGRKGERKTLEPKKSET